MAKTQFTAICRLLHLLLQPGFAKEPEACLCWKNESTARSHTKYLKISAWNHSEICYKHQLCVPSNSESQLWGDFGSIQEEHLRARTQRRPEPHQWGVGSPREVCCGATGSHSTGLTFLPAAPSLSGTLCLPFGIAQLRWESHSFLVLCCSGRPQQVSRSLQGRTPTQRVSEALLGESDGVDDYSTGCAWGWQHPPGR